MGRAPAYVFVVRHGNRLDAANKQWHITSPTPYDPPLTFSGWGQARALGQKIGEILRERELQDEASATESSPKKRRKYKVVLHSSPFLRCIQTSIGISAGLASLPQVAVRQENDDQQQPASAQSKASGRFRPPINTDLPRSTFDPAQFLPSLPIYPEESRPDTPTTPLPIQKTVLRLDAFLGEWLTPGYFELITPPPGSGLMLASAKAELLRKEDYSQYPQFVAQPQQPSHAHHNSSGGQMWSSPVSAISNAASNTGFQNPSSMAQVLNRANRSASVNSNQSEVVQGFSRRGSASYVHPVPAYAISHNGEIPKGFVPHARDNCCAIDYQWDSMRGSLNWGDGGQLGEEWTEMHRRFRKGLQRLLDWYCTAENPTEMVTKERRSSGTNGGNSNERAVEEEEEEEDAETESVVILVTHGAGCNALIGAITHQPVLTDVALASLTSAIRKPEKDDDVEDPAIMANDSSDAALGLIVIHQHYDLKLFASTDHLQSTRSSRSPSLNINRGRPPSTFASSPLSGLFSGYDGSGSRSSSAAANFANTRREPAFPPRVTPRIGLNTSGLGGGITVGSGATSFTRQSPRTGIPAGGLWSPLRNGIGSDDDDDFLPNFGNSDFKPRPAAPQEPPQAVEPKTPVSLEPSVDGGSPTNGNKPINGSVPATESEHVSTSAEATESSDTKDEELDQVALPNRQLGSGIGGLWGSPQTLMLNPDVQRDWSSAKRRWTFNEREW